MSCLSCFLLKIVTCNVIFYVCIWYDWIYVYSIPALRVLLTVLNNPEYCIPKGGISPSIELNSVTKLHNNNYSKPVLLVGNVGFILSLLKYKFQQKQPKWAKTCPSMILLHSLLWWTWFALTGQSNQKCTDCFFLSWLTTTQLWKGTRKG